MKIISKLLLSVLMLTFSSALFAGIEDWQGTFTIKNSSGGQSTIVHRSTGLDILSMMHSKTFTFSGSGMNLNGFSPSSDGVMDVNMKIDDFRQQVTKFGTIVDEQITRGPTYPA